MRQNEIYSNNTIKIIGMIKIAVFQCKNSVNNNKTTHIPSKESVIDQRCCISKIHPLCFYIKHALAKKEGTVGNLLINAQSLTLFTIYNDDSTLFSAHRPPEESIKVNINCAPSPLKGAKDKKFALLSPLEEIWGRRALNIL